MNIHGITLSTDQQNGSTEQKTFNRTAMKIHGGTDQNTLPRIDIKGQIAYLK